MIWLKDRDGKVIWDGNPIYTKGVHVLHRPDKIMRILDGVQKYNPDEARPDVPLRAKWVPDWE